MHVVSLRGVCPGVGSDMSDMRQSVQNQITEKHLLCKTSHTHTLWTTLGSHHTASLYMQTHTFTHTNESTNTLCILSLFLKYTHTHTDIYTGLFTYPHNRIQIS